DPRRVWVEPGGRLGEQMTALVQPGAGRAPVLGRVMDQAPGTRHGFVLPRDGRPIADHGRRHHRLRPGETPRPLVSRNVCAAAAAWAECSWVLCPAPLITT